MADTSDAEVDYTLANPDTVTKYRQAADFAKAAVQKVAAECKDGAKIVDLCNLGDKSIIDACAGCFKGKKIAKGVAFPTCISVNHTVGHNSPLNDDTSVLVAGDMVKIDLGCHIDGLVAVVAHTVVVGEKEVTGRKADVLMAAKEASEAVIRMMNVGTTNTEITAVIEKIAAAYGCNPVEGVLSHSLTRNTIDGEKVIMNKSNPEQKVEEFKLEAGDVYAIDVVMSTGAGKAREEDSRTTVYKRTNDTYQLKMKASRAVYAEIKQKFEFMPFTLRHFEDEKKARMGIVECVKHELVTPYPVLWEKAGEHVAQFKFTALVQANGPSRITEGPEFAFAVKSDKKIEDEAVKAILALELKKKDKKKK